MINWKKWRHITKLDPDKVLIDGVIDDIASSGTDALMLSGTLNVTPDNLSKLYDKVQDTGLTIVVEPSNPLNAIFKGMDLMFVPSVFNSAHPMFITGLHKEWVLSSKIEWDKVISEAYVVLNPNSSVSKLSHANCNLSPKEVAAYAIIAEKYYHMPVFYIEYSGVYGDVNVSKAVRDVSEDIVIFYGGGINSAEKAAEMGQYADVIVVGNAIYDTDSSILKDTVNAVK
ncbi:MAG TPA: heptaprenylglyceryl phosphate synthase [Methanocorpusculum sp.]|nr:heptaprenylglyceryl phosphate synthase [Methanocorpusculum sp.]